MSEAFATVQDIMDLWRPLTTDEQTRAGNLLPLVSDTLRNEAKKVGKDLDTLVTEDETYSSVVKLVTVDVVARVLRQTTTGDAMTQESQSAGGYSWSGTYAVPGGGIANAILYSDLKRLGLLNQQIGSVRIWQRSRENQ
jgi:hypothetical protein